MSHDFAWKINIWSHPPTDLLTSASPAVGAQIQVAPDSLDVLNHTTALLPCTARGDPPPIISWEHNGVTVENSDDGRVQILPNGSLLISPVMLADMGGYQCLANNTLGADESDVAMLMIDGGFYLFTS